MNTINQTTDTLNVNLAENVSVHMSEPNSFWFIFFGVLLSYAGLVLFYWIKIIRTKRYHKKNGRPFSFNWNYFWNDNWTDIGIVVPALPFVIIFYPEFFDIVTKIISKWVSDDVVVIFNGYGTLTTFTSFGVGFASIFLHRRLNKLITKVYNKIKNQNNAKKSGLES